MPFTPASSSTSGLYEAIFHSTSLDLHVPPADHTHVPSSPGEVSDWWRSLRDATARNVAFLDEKLAYFVSIDIPNQVLANTSSNGGDQPPSELLRFLARLQLTLNASFLPPLSPLRKAPPPNLDLDPNETASASTLAPPSASQGHFARLQNEPRSSRGEGSSSGSFGDGGIPITPNPYPSMNEGEEQYADVEGVTVWEGMVEVPEDTSSARDHTGHVDVDKDRWIVKTPDGWTVIWKGEVPIAYVRTTIQNPLLSLTTSITLRDAAVKRRTTNVETGSLNSATETIQGPAEDDNVEASDFAEMQEIDLLGGLTGGNGIMPSSRLGESHRQDLSLPPVSPSSALPLTAITPSTAAAEMTPTTAGSVPLRERAQPHITHEAASTLRKSYRRVMSLSMGLRVRMRTLFLPQLLPPRRNGNTSGDHDENDGEGEGEKKVVLCVEVENPSESETLSHGFEVKTISVDIGGKGGKATASLVCQPSVKGSDGTNSAVFPLKLVPVEQYNLLYAVDIASAPEDRNGQGVEEALARTLGKGDEQRPVAITIIGRPYAIPRTAKGSLEDSGTENALTTYPTTEFSSRWNCTLDLASFYASLANTILPPVAAQAATSRNRNSKPIPTPANAIAGDKRYSLASLLAKSDGQNGPNGNSHAVRPGQQRLVSGTTQRPIPLPTTAPDGRVMSYRAPNQRSMESYGLLVSVKVLSDGGQQGIAPLEAFSLEVFAHNRTNEVKRFRISVPGPDDWTNTIRDIWAKKRRRTEGEVEWGVDEILLRTSLISNLSRSPALIPLEDDVRCGPLLPGASMSSRLRFIALRAGVHTLEKIRITGANDEFDFVMSPVLDVVVGSGSNPQQSGF